MMVGLMAGRMVGHLAGRMVGHMAGRMVGHMAGHMVGGCRTGIHDDPLGERVTGRSMGRRSPI